MKVHIILSMLLMCYSVTAVFPVILECKYLWKYGVSDRKSNQYTKIIFDLIKNRTKSFCTRISIKYLKSNGDESGIESQVHMIGLETDFHFSGDN